LAQRCCCMPWWLGCRLPPPLPACQHTFRSCCAKQPPSLGQVAQQWPVHWLVVTGISIALFWVHALHVGQPLVAASVSLEGHVPVWSTLPLGVMSSPAMPVRGIRDLFSLALALELSLSTRRCKLITGCGSCGMQGMEVCHEYLCWLPLLVELLNSVCVATRRRPLASYIVVKSTLLAPWVLRHCAGVGV